MGRKPIESNRGGLFDINEKALHHVVAFAPGPQVLSAELLGEVIAEAPEQALRGREASATEASRDVDSSKKEKKDKKVRLPVVLQ